MPGVSVTAKASKGRYAYGETIDLAVQVRNGSTKRVFVVAEPYLWSTAADRIHVQLAESAPTPGLGYYNYLPPRLRGIGPGETVTLSVAVGLPPREGELDSSGHYFWKENPVAGNVTIDVTVGYLRHPFRPTSAAPWAEFLAEQQQVKPANIKVHVEPR